MRETRSSGSVEGVVSNHDPYSDSEQDKLFALGCECRINRSRRNVVEVIADGLQRDPEQKLHHLVFLVACGQELLTPISDLNLMN
jgi:hypothetical protein